MLGIGGVGDNTTYTLDEIKEAEVGKERNRENIPSFSAYALCAYCRLA